GQHTVEVRFVKEKAAGRDNEHFILLMTMPICLQDLQTSSYLLSVPFSSAADEAAKLEL
ncbi:hypothetical protein STEG23_037279, partial [Scotinomys teguina]